MKEYRQKLSEHFTDILDSFSEGITVSDSEGNFIYCNDAYVKLSGVPRSEMIGKNATDLIKNGLFSESSTLKVLQTKQPISIMQQISTNREHLVTGVPIFDEKGTIQLVVNTNRDVTELSRLRENLVEQTRITQQYRKELQDLREHSTVAPGLIAHSECMRRVIESADNIAQFDATVLLLGESGVGKEVVAQRIRQVSPRSEKPFIRVNCGAIPKELVESELFGYEPGAFTGANRQGKAGVFEQAHQGTLFLDEIGELPPELQKKLLRVLQDFEITRIGGTRPIKTDIRLITATNRDLKAMVRRGEFREDLYYRLNVVPIHIPPLRKRQEDILPLTYLFLDKNAKKYGRKKTFSAEAFRCLESYNWPGNVRELENLVERVFIMSRTDEIDRSDLPESILRPTTEKQDGTFPVSDEQLAPDWIQAQFHGKTLHEAVQDFERWFLESSLQGESNLRAAARRLGIDASTLSRKVRKYGLKRTLHIHR